MKIPARIVRQARIPCAGDARYNFALCAAIGSRNEIRTIGKIKLGVSEYECGSNFSVVSFSLCFHR